MRVALDKKKWRWMQKGIYAALFMAVMFIGWKSGFCVKAAASQCELVYKLSEEYIPVKGDSSYVKIERNKNFYLKYEIGREKIAGSTVTVYIENEAGETKRIDKILCTSINEDYYYGSAENCAYLPISLKTEQGAIKIYFEIAFADGDVEKQYGPGSGNAFCLELLGEYTISYDANGGINAPDSQTKYAESPLALTLEEPVRKGYIFKGWAVSNAGEEISYRPGDMYEESKGRTLFAVWKLDVRPVVDAPLEQSVKAGESAAFHVTAKGDHPDDYSYQWYYANSQDGTGIALAKETDPDLVITKATKEKNGCYYYCVIYDGFSDEYVESGRARLTVYSEPTVTGPIGKSVKAGEAAQFGVAASGGNPSNYTYQWYYALSQSGTGIQINGAVSSVYTIPGNQVTAGMNGRYYYCEISNGIYRVTSSRAKLTVQSASGSGGESNNNSNNGNSNSSNGNGSNGSGNNNSGKSRRTQKIKASSYVKEYGSKGFYLKAKTTGDGKLTYSSSNRKVAAVSSSGKVSVKKYGTAVLTIRASKTENYYAASKKVQIKIVPKKMAITKAKSPDRRKIEIKWKADKTVAGYEIEISSQKNFKSHTIVRNYKKAKERVVLVGVSSGKTYYVRMRSHVKVGKSKYYSSWSKVKKVKIK